MNYPDARDFRLFAESFIYGIRTYDTYIHTYRHTDTDSVLQGLAQARPNKNKGDTNDLKEVM